MTQGFDIVTDKTISKLLECNKNTLVADVGESIKMKATNLNLLLTKLNYHIRLLLLTLSNHALAALSMGLNGSLVSARKFPKKVSQGQSSALLIAFNQANKSKALTTLVILINLTLLRHQSS